MNRKCPLAVLVLSSALAASGCALHFPEDSPGEVSVEIDFTPLVNARTGVDVPAFIGKPWQVDLQMIESSSGGCGTTVDSGRQCSGPSMEPIAFRITSAACDDDLCDVTDVFDGDAEIGSEVTLVPQARHVVLRVTGKGDGMTASQSLAIDATAP
jgi:hypothetical protein